MIEIFYYSGTGYTLSAARILQKEMIGDVKLTPIVSIMGQKEIIIEANVIGFLMPMHAFGVPRAFIEFFNQIKIIKADYLFSLVTRGGAPVKMHKEINKYLRKNKVKLNAFKYATAPNTFDPIFEVHTTRETVQDRASFDSDVTCFAEVINQRESSIDIGRYRNFLFENTMFPLLKVLNRLTGYFKLQDSFYSDKNCIGCGECEKMCLSGKIYMEGNKPVWNKDVSCQYCLACLHLCPSKAIQVSNSQTHLYDRMAHPDVKPSDISSQKM